MLVWDLGLDLDQLIIKKNTICIVIINDNNNMVRSIVLTYMVLGLEFTCT